MYFPSPGPVNTKAVAELVAAEAVKRGISAIVAASNTGQTVEVLLEAARKAGYAGSLVWVSHVWGFVKNGENEMDPAIRARLEEAGVRVCSAAHALSGTERGISRKFQGAYPVEIIAHTLRMLGQGTKVCVEIAVMALDGGFIEYGKPVIAVGGSGRGADTAAVLSPGYAHSFFETRVHEILCKPALR
jgi:hypothetical protein